MILLSLPLPFPFLLIILACFSPNKLHVDKNHTHLVYIYFPSWFHVIDSFFFFKFNIFLTNLRAHPEPSSLLPPHTIPLGRPSAPAPSIQHRALNLDWHLVSYMTFHMFQCQAFGYSAIHNKRYHEFLSEIVVKVI